MTSDDMQKLLGELSELPDEARKHAALTISAQMLEFAAYEHAGVLQPEFVADMLIMAARLDRARKKSASQNRVLDDQKI